MKISRKPEPKLDLEFLFHKKIRKKQVILELNNRTLSFNLS